MFKLFLLRSTSHVEAYFVDWDLLDYCLRLSFGRMTLVEWPKGGGWDILIEEKYPRIGYIKQVPAVTTVARSFD